MHKLRRIPPPACWNHTFEMYRGDDQSVSEKALEEQFDIYGQRFFGKIVYQDKVSGAYYVTILWEASCY